MTLNEITSTLRGAGISEGDHVLVHTSLKAVGFVEGGPSGFVEALLTAVGTEGTMLFPGMSPGERKPNEHIVSTFFDPPAPWVGKVPAAAVHHPNAFRSMHPTHSVIAIGRLAEDLTRDHHLCESPCGKGSPFHKLYEEGGKLLMVGCNFDSCTSLHFAEEWAGVPYHLQEGQATFACEDKDGTAVSGTTKIHRWHGTSDLNRIANHVHKFWRPFVLGEAHCFWIASEILVDTAVEVLKADANALRTSGTL